MRDAPDQQAINNLVQALRSKHTPQNTQRNGHATARGGLSDGQVLEKLFGGPEGQKWRKVYSGNWEDYDYKSQSDADAAILHKLAFWTNRDAVQMERIMRGSGLVRDKWDSRRGGSTWLADDIAGALENTSEGYSPTKFPNSHSLGSSGIWEFQDENLKQSIQAISFTERAKPQPRGWIVHNQIWEGHATSWFGEGGSAKSLLALHLALTVALETERYWFTFAVKTVPVLYIDFELDTDEQHRRALDLSAGMGLDDIPDNFYYLSAAMMSPKEAFGIAAEECHRLGIGLVIVDSVGFAIEGDSENARDVLGFYKTCIQPLKDLGASPLLIDHQAKVIKGEKYSDKQAFGSVYKMNAVRSSFQIRGSYEQDATIATFTHKKNNFGWKEKDFSLSIAFKEECITVERLGRAMPDPDREPSKKEQVLEAIKGMSCATAEGAAKETGIELKTVQNCVTELLKEHAIEVKGKEGRARILGPKFPNSQTTKGMGMGIADEGFSGEDENAPHECGDEECVSESDERLSPYDGTTVSEGWITRYPGEGCNAPTENRQSELNADPEGDWRTV